MMTCVIITAKRLCQSILDTISSIYAKAARLCKPRSGMRKQACRAGIQHRHVSIKAERP